MLQRSDVLANATIQAEENGNRVSPSHKNQVMLSQLLANASTPSFHELYALGHNGSAHSLRKTHKCCVYIASNDKYCARLNSIQAFCDINRDVRLSTKYLYRQCTTFDLFIDLNSIKFSQVIGEASHLSRYPFSAHNNFIHPSAEMGSKSTVRSVIFVFFPSFFICQEMCLVFLDPFNVYHLIDAIT